MEVNLVCILELTARVLKFILLNLEFILFVKLGEMSFVCLAWGFLSLGLMRGDGCVQVLKDILLKGTHRKDILSKATLSSKDTHSRDTLSKDTLSKDTLSSKVAAAHRSARLFLQLYAVVVCLRIASEHGRIGISGGVNGDDLIFFKLRI